MNDQRTPIGVAANGEMIYLDQTPVDDPYVLISSGKSRWMQRFLDAFRDPPTLVIDDLDDEDLEDTIEKMPLGELTAEAHAALEMIDHRIDDLQRENIWSSWDVIMIQFSNLLESFFYRHNGQWLRLDEGRWYSLDEMREVVSTAVFLEQHEIVSKALFL